MNTALVLVAAIMAIVAVSLFTTNRLLMQKLREEHADSRRREGTLEAAIIDERQRAQGMIDHERARHAEEITRMAALHNAAIEKVLHMVSYGSPTPKPAVVKDEEPDAESRLIAGISEDMVTIGGRRIQQEYEAIGQVVSIEECEAEARSMLYGVSPQVPPNLGSLGDGHPPRD